MNITLSHGAALFGFACVVVGSFLPWATVGIFSVSGTDGDGVLTLVLGGIGLMLAFVARTPRPMYVALGAAGIAAFIGIYDANNIASVAGNSSDTDFFSFEPEVGSGLYLVIAGSLAATVGSWRHAGNLQRALRAATPVSDTDTEPEA